MLGYSPSLLKLATHVKPISICRSFNQVSMVHIFNRQNTIFASRIAQFLLPSNTIIQPDRGVKRGKHLQENKEAWAAKNVVHDRREDYNDQENDER
uniref:Uncharacterized protein n=1 Tax=Ciona savignyi TaxID=51511 RepID=H2Y7J7_CIOSA